MKKIVIIFSIFAIVVIIYLCSITDTVIYISKPNYVDITLQIDNKVILTDSLTYSSYIVPSLVKHKKLCYGLHKISVLSAKENISQEKTVFILPNQFINIEFYEADTSLLWLDYFIGTRSMIIKDSGQLDSLIELHKNIENLNVPVVIKKADFVIQTGSNPFRIE